jgi:hypothetical protein
MVSDSSDSLDWAGKEHAGNQHAHCWSHMLHQDTVGRHAGGLCAQTAVHQLTGLHCSCPLTTDS